MTSEDMRENAEKELQRMNRMPKRRIQKQKRLFQTERWNNTTEHWEDVVILAVSQREADKIARGQNKVRRVKDFV